MSIGIGVLPCGCRRHVRFTGDSDGVVINNDTWLH